MEKIKEYIKKVDNKKVIRYVQMFDGIWSIPLSFLVFFLAGRFGFEYFGDTLISTEYVQLVAMAAFILIIGNFVVYLGINFNFRKLQRYIYSEQVKFDLENTIHAWQKIKLYFIVYFSYLLLFLFILWLLMTAIVSELPPVNMLE